MLHFCLIYDDGDDYDDDDAGDDDGDGDGDGDGYICQQYRERAMHSKVITSQIQPKSSFLYLIFECCCLIHVMCPCPSVYPKVDGGSPSPGRQHLGGDLLLTVISVC